MPKFVCRCGYIMPMHSDANPYEFEMILAKVIYEIGTAIGNKTLDGDGFYSKIDNHKDTLDIIKCSQCHRIYIEDKSIPDQDVYISYVPECEPPPE